MVFAFRWTGAALASGVMGFPLLVRPIRLALETIDRRLEDAAATLGANPALVFFTVTLPLALARYHRRRADVFCPRAWRIWRDDHFCLQHSRRDANDLCRDLHIPANSRRRRRGRTAGRGRHRLCRLPRSLPPNGSAGVLARAFTGNDRACASRWKNSSARSRLRCDSKSPAASPLCSARREPGKPRWSI